MMEFQTGWAHLWWVVLTWLQKDKGLPDVVVGAFAVDSNPSINYYMCPPPDQCISDLAQQVQQKTSGKVSTGTGTGVAQPIS